MEVAQVYSIVNSATSQVLGETAVLKEDLTNIVDIGTEVFNSNAVDNYVRKLVDHIGKVIFVNRPYRGSVPSVLMDGWEYGSVLEKIRAELPEAKENPAWNLQDGQSYDDHIFYQPQVSVKFFNNKSTFQIPVSFTKRQVKESFSNETQLNAFISMLYTAVETSVTVKMDSLVMMTICNMIAQTLASEYPSAGYGAKSGIRAVNLLYLYNQEYGQSLTADKAVKTPEFIRFAAYTIGVYSDRMTRLSKLFNVGGTNRFTPKDLQHIVMLSDFAKASEVYLQSDTFHDELVALPSAETVPYWQGSGVGYDFGSISSLNVTIDVDGTDTAVNAGGILAVIFDHDALGVTNIYREVETSYTASAQFFNNYYDMEAGYFNDLNENFVVFFVADAAA